MAGVAAGPLVPDLLDVVVDVFAEISARRHHLRLQADPRADDVVLDDHLRALRIGGIANELPAAIAQLVQAPNGLRVPRPGPEEARIEPRRARGLIHALDGLDPVAGVCRL